MMSQKNGDRLNSNQFMHLTNEQISRFSRQLLIPELGTKGQCNILSSSVLVIGAGGLGASVILYLAAAGVGKLGIVDYDSVEESNLQRQVIHDETKIGMKKCHSAKESVSRLNSKCECIAYDCLINSENALEIVGLYDVIVDATDNVATRYLLNDASILSHKPLVSASALRLEGQLTVYNYNNGPCYRCLFPVPPDPKTVTNCSDGGVLGVVTGILGCLQALEVIKIISEIGPSYSQKMLLVDALSGAFRVIKLRNKRANCAVCGDNPTITKLIDYVEFCGSSATDKTISENILEPHERITCMEYSNILKSETKHLLIDVRAPVQYDICSLNHSANIPWRELELNHEISIIQNAVIEKVPIYVICRLGNDSQLAVRHLKTQGIENVCDIIGGLDQWAIDVDNKFARY